MSVKSLANTIISVYSCITSTDSYGANTETYFIKYTNLSARIRQLRINYETFINGKEMNVSIYRIYVPSQLNILASDMIVDVHRTPYRKYDILYVNKMDRKRHMQIDVKRVEMILGTDSCPNIITGWNGSIVKAI